MCVPNIQISKEDISHVEKILFNKTGVFDNQRIDYIMDFRTLDLMAVPGSGKTTLLLAKLLLLEKYLPFDDNSGVLVLSHTNTAVNEINHRIKKYCPKLFSYPNHIGTIQSFVNHFLARPYYEKLERKKVRFIDDNRYYIEVEKRYQNMSNFKLKEYLKRQSEPLELLMNIRYNKDKELILGLDGTVDKFPLKNKETASYKGLKRFKKALLKDGCLHYDDAYYLANRYLDSYHDICDLLRERFKYVFVDEMQDMDFHQVEIIDRIFEEGSDSIPCFQRIGDRNQAIYNYKVHSESLWKKRDIELTINGSNRLSEDIAEFASLLAVDGNPIKGMNEEPPFCLPTIIVYEDRSTQCQVIKEFSKYIRNVYRNIELNNFTYKVIAWRKSNDDPQKLTLSSYCPKYLEMGIASESVKASQLTDTYEIAIVIKKLICDFINENNSSDNQSVISSSNLYRFIESNRLYDLEKLKTLLLELVTNIYENNIMEFNKKFKILLFDMSKTLKIQQNVVNDFTVNTNIVMGNLLQPRILDHCDKCNVKNFSPVLGSVHSVKGETHDVTLFLESIYSSKHEVEILYEVLLGKSVAEMISSIENEIKQLQLDIETIKSKKITRGIKTRENKIIHANKRIEKLTQYAKLVYVASTRPKSILGLGINRLRFDKYLNGKIDKKKWMILELDKET